MAASPEQMSSANGNRIAAQGPAAGPLVFGILDTDGAFWPELEVSVASDGSIKTSKVSDDKPQDWKYLVALAEEWSA